MVNDSKKDTTSKDNGLPLVILVGPTNAGKSTLFNRFIGIPQAVTAKEKATTRDRVIGVCNWQNRYFNLVDTAGLLADDHDFGKLSTEQLDIAISEADLIVFTFDGKEGLDDRSLQEINRLRHKPMFLVANKIDSYELEKKYPQTDLGLPYFAVSSYTGRRTGDLLQAICEQVDAPKNYLSTKHPVIAIIGRPNVGKSTLLNSLVGSNRSIVSHISGTTRDVVTHTLVIDDKTVTLADTAGIRRRGKIALGPELFSVKRTATILQNSTAVLVIFDIKEGATRGDIHMLQFARDLKKPVLIVYNKLDLIKDNRPFIIKPFLTKYPSVTVSAKNNINLDAINEWIKDQIITY